MRKILDAKYKKLDLNKVITKQCQQINTKEWKRLLSLLRKSEYLFDGMLGTWNTTPVYLELKDDVKPVWLQPYPVPSLHEEMFRKKVKRLVILGVLEEANDSEWGAPLFDQPKAKINPVRFLSDFWNLNRQLKRKPYLMSKWREMLLNLEGFQYDASLDLHMVYYQIHLSKQASNLCTNILPWQKYRYKCLKWRLVNPQTFYRRKWTKFSVDLNLSNHTSTIYW